ncbi:phage virion morphogenesis protein [Roseospira marina]|uniref:Phage virion morphogenesis protein n=1 Tax=Roseospira marina TaxID=140057 RepID=A0A5M6I3R0_9PROT|nr:phage virion morphogenesis protein [Roseospira marina]KAA5602802.1 phage virion morphogenesis protein [Roseospira marina]MBB4316227.1 phage virion morphogenesis protein [Roseospira marina]MBB5089430.1 phage virion morphogenesis protein [Roseospira marina]
MADLEGAPGLDAWMERALRALDAGALRGVVRDIAATARRRTQARMATQTAPDGTPWAPRREQETDHNGGGPVRRRAAMMRGLRRARRLRILAAGDRVAIGWRGRDGRIAALHHHGGRDHIVEGRPGTADYPARPLLGWTPEDIAAVRRALVLHLTS